MLPSGAFSFLLWGLMQMYSQADIEFIISVGFVCWASGLTMGMLMRFVRNIFTSATISN